MLAQKYNISVNIDAEEANRLELSLDLIEKLLDEPELKDYKGIGFVVQSYSKRCPYVLDYLINLAREKQHYLMIRLVKGAYWDSEIKWAQTDGLDDFPLFTRKNHTDIAYVACAKNCWRRRMSFTLSLLLITFSQCAPFMNSDKEKI
ncbi:bifunctional proline dehydrogenase/pyrroline-5-carboxylate dehydrogenase [Rodentibacter pneumotropicus]|uniref:Bifunctional proline dehydrogenase/pyrroline-5-carboxylate dehydrogenase n=1 Tax=Rodentibacter pneumotropicus TaxID=758 RepID=A0A3S4VFL9_9PAST|nr:bifunctional proline dehydrogenase/pyrroline-5-carboxylate dehydrogenase [Rodentibacter pneumotropicus]